MSKWREYREMVVMGFGIVMVALALAWCSQPRVVMVDGVRCVEAGLAQYTTLSCDWKEGDNGGR